MQTIDIILNILYKLNIKRIIIKRSDGNLTIKKRSDGWYEKEGIEHVNLHDYGISNVVWMRFRRRF